MNSGVPVDSAHYRSVLGHFCTGVAVITTMDGPEPVGFACQSFAALSIEPALVLFCPSKGSRSWPSIERSGKFAVNVLGAGQQKISSIFGSRNPDKFAGLSWSPSASGCPLIGGALAWIDCAVHSVHDAGDHYIVLGAVHELGSTTAESPLLFFRGRYAQPDANSTPAPIRDDLGELLTWPGPDDWF